MPPRPGRRSLERGSRALVRRGRPRAECDRDRRATGLDAAEPSAQAREREGRARTRRLADHPERTDTLAARARPERPHLPDADPVPGGEVPVGDERRVVRTAHESRYVHERRVPRRRPEGRSRAAGPPDPGTVRPPPPPSVAARPR